MDGHGGHPSLLHGPGQLHAVDGALIPAQAHLYGDGPAARPPDHRLSHPDGLVRGAHQPRAVPGIGHLGHRAAHVDVQDVGAGDLPGNGGGLLHTPLVAAEQLGGGGVLPFPQLEQRQGLLILITQGLGGHHLGNGIARPQFPADGAEG